VRTNVCVFCSSSNSVHPEFFKAATELGVEIARRNLTLIYGGGRLGLMGALATAATQHGGRVVGIIPDFMHASKLAFDDVDEMIITQGMRERKADMEIHSDAFVCLPGGFGTLEEILEILTYKQLALHDKPIVLVNTRGFFGPLLEMFDSVCRERFAKPEHLEMYYVTQDVADVFDYIEAYTPTPLEKKWL
jgi:uncharacterized protein (TIGR00730 family)